MSVDFLQIGFQKCGSTFFENQFYSNNKYINCIQAGKYRALKSCLINELILPESLEYAETHFLERFNELYLRKYLNDNMVNGIMFEPFTFMNGRKIDRKNVIDRIQAFGDGIKIITSVRNQFTWLLSHYSQYIKSGGLLTFRDFLQAQLQNPHLDAHYIDWYPLIKYLYQKFGRENVLVCFFEDMNTSPQSTVDKISSFLNVPSQQVNQKKVNPSWGKTTLGLRRLTNFFIRYDCGASIYTFNADMNDIVPGRVGQLYHSMIYKYYKPYSTMVLAKMNKYFPSKKIQMKDEQITSITKRYGMNNRKLADLLDRDLEALGYPVQILS